MQTRLTRIWVFVWLWSRSRESKTRVEDMKVYQVRCSLLGRIIEKKMHAASMGLQHRSETSRTDLLERKRCDPQNYKSNLGQAI